MPFAFRSLNTYLTLVLTMNINFLKFKKKITSLQVNTKSTIKDTYDTQSSKTDITGRGRGGGV